MKQVTDDSGNTYNIPIYLEDTFHRLLKEAAATKNYEMFLETFSGYREKLSA